MCSKQRLIELASQFRNALMKCDKHNLHITLQYFPHGACGDATYLLAKFLEEAGCGEFDYVSGIREHDNHSHAWLEQNGIIVDITADQFYEQEASVLVTSDKTWHSQFEEQERHQADFERLDDRSIYFLKDSYNKVKTELKT